MEAARTSRHRRKLHLAPAHPSSLESPNQRLFSGLECICDAGDCLSYSYPTAINHFLGRINRLGSLSSQVVLPLSGRPRDEFSCLSSFFWGQQKTQCESESQSASEMRMIVVRHEYLRRYQLQLGRHESARRPRPKP